jgi:hypothetical protein
MAIKQTAAYEPYIGNTTYEDGSFSGGYPGAGWTYNDEQGGWTKPTPNPNTPSQFSLEDIKNRSGYAFDPNQQKLVTDFKNESLSPSAYYNQLAKDLAEASFNISGVNGDSSEYDALIEGLKDVSPKAYYTAKIDVLSRAAGNNYINNEMGRMEIIQNQIKDLLPEAQKAGVSPDQVNQTYQSGFSGGTQLGQQVLANKGGGAFLTPLVEGIKFVGPGLLGMYGIDSALTAGLGAGYGAATGMSTVGLGSGIGGAAAMEGGALAGLGSLGAGGVGGAGALTAAELMGPTYGELGFTGVEGGFAGPTYAEMGYTGLNQGQAIAAADAASKGMSVSEILSNANRVRSGANTLAKLLGGGSTTGSTGGLTGGTTGGANTQQLASLLALPTQAAPGGLYRMNQNPFNFGTQGQTVASQGMYDVSGTNPMANALRKA